MQTLHKDCTFDGCCQLLGAIVQRAKADGDTQWINNFLDGIAGNERVLSSVVERKTVAKSRPLKAVSLRRKRRKAKRRNVPSVHTH